MPAECAELLRVGGWECDTVFDEALNGAADADIAIRCQAEARVLFTLGLNLADFRAYPPSDYSGVVVLRPFQADRNSVPRLLREAVRPLRTERTEPRLWIVEPGWVRIRESGDPSD